MRSSTIGNDTVENSSTWKFICSPSIEQPSTVKQICNSGCVTRKSREGEVLGVELEAGFADERSGFSGVHCCACIVNYLSPGFFVSAGVLE